MLQYRKFTSAPTRAGLQGPPERSAEAFPARSAAGKGREGWLRERTGAAGRVLTVKHAAPMDHVCALHQRLRAPLIPFRDGKTSSGGGRTGSRGVKDAKQERNKGGPRGRPKGRGSSEPTLQPDPDESVLRPGRALALAGPQRRAASSIPTVTLASHPGAGRHHPRRRRQDPPPGHRRRRRVWRTRREAGGERGASPGTPPSRCRGAGAARWGPVQTDGSDGAGGGGGRDGSVPSLRRAAQQVGAASPGGCPAAALLAPALGDLPLRH
ncbi:uncharacterized protein LOC106994572 [Macaca mulatta]